MTANTVAVVDIGKTNAKVALVDLGALTETLVAKTANQVVASGPYPHFDVDGLWDFILEGFSTVAKTTEPDAVVVTTHGAALVLTAADGSLAMPMLDYEFDGPDSLAAEYDAVRPDFAETGSPRLPVGLNAGAQLFWQAKAFPDALARTAAILTGPQYWASRLCGVASCEPTSLGAHTDLWNPQKRDFSSLVDRMGWRPLMAPLSQASDRLGALKPEVAARTRLPPDIPVFSGIHDSNASLLPHLLARTPPFAVVSTGTWVIVMAVGAGGKVLNPGRDTLMNVNAFGDPVPSARFMGGREFSLVVGDRTTEPSAKDIRSVLETPIVLTPSVEATSGPFQGRRSAWQGVPSSDGERMAAASFYLAMMTATCLELTGAAGEVIVEGPFAGNALYLKMLASAVGRSVRASSAGTGTNIGAALLCRPRDTSAATAGGETVKPDAACAAYAERWRRIVRSAG